MIPEELNVFYEKEIMIAGIELVSATYCVTKVDKQMFGRFFDVYSTLIKTNESKMVKNDLGG